MMTMNRFVLAAIVALSLTAAACSGGGTEPSPAPLTITPGSVVMAVNAEQCFTVSGGYPPYSRFLRYEDSTGITTTPNAFGCLQFSRPTTFTLTVTDSRNNTAVANGAAR